MQAARSAAARARRPSNGIRSRSLTRLLRPPTRYGDSGDRGIMRRVRDSLDRFRILSLDGGGSWALIQVKTLARLYGAGARGHDVLRDFDLAIANSGGSIVLAALAANLELANTLHLFMSEGERRKVFVSRDLRAVTKAFGVGPRYHAAKKLDGLRARSSGPACDAPMSGWQLTNAAGRPVRLGHLRVRLRPRAARVFFQHGTRPRRASPRRGRRSPRSRRWPRRRSPRPCTRRATRR